MDCKEFESSLFALSSKCDTPDDELDLLKKLSSHAESCDRCGVLFRGYLAMKTDREMETDIPLSPGGMPQEDKERIANKIRKQLGEPPHLGDKIMHGQPGYVMPSTMGMVEEPKVIVSVNKLDNGYSVRLYEPPVYDEPTLKEVDAELAAADADHDKQIDKMIDGVIAFTKSLNDKAAGETWKGDDNQERIREGFKLLFGMSRRGRGTPLKRPPQPRSEQMVFPQKEELLAYLAKNL